MIKSIENNQKMKKRKKQSKQIKGLMNFKKVKEKDKAPKGKDLPKMSRQEKKAFLSMDLIERMIRIEQRVSASFNKEVSYDQTEYYKSLLDNEKKMFERHLKKNKRKKFLFGSVLFISFLFLAFMRIELTGNVINQTIDNNTVTSLLEPVSIFVILGICILFLITLLTKKKRFKKFEKNFKILDDTFLRKRMIQHLG